MTCGTWSENTSSNDICDIVAERSKARGSGPRLARGVGSNPTDVNSCLSAFAGLHRCQQLFIGFCRPNRCQALLQKTGEAREVSPSRSRLLLSIEATPPGTDLKLFFSYKC